jgi:DNA-binding transcriptional ArsR family regulator
VDNPHAGPTLSDSEVDALFHALSDATRRDILRRCLDQEPSVSRLAAIYPVSLTAIQKHVRVLEEAGLVERRKHGREQRVHTRHEGIAQARQALDTLEATWKERIQRMESVLDDLVGNHEPTGDDHGLDGH